MVIGNPESLSMLYDGVLIQKETRFENPEKVGRILIPKSTVLSMRESKIGKVVSVGPGFKNKHSLYFPTGLNRGDLVYYARYGKTLIDFIDFGTYIIVTERQVLALVKDETNEQALCPGDVSPRNDRILCKPLYEKDEITKSGIIVKRYDESHTEDKLLPYEVVKTGPGKPNYQSSSLSRREMPVFPGDTIFVDEMAGASVSFWNGSEFEKFRLVAAEDIHVVLPKEEVNV